MASKTNGGLLVVIGIVLVILFGFWYLNSYTSDIVDSLQPVEQISTKGEISINKNDFVPNLLRINVGEEVTWINNESFPHDVISDTGLFKSPKMATGEKYSYTFTKEGTFTYHCSIHPFMHGSIVVAK